MKKLSDYILISDVDGTLLSREGELPQRNIDAIARFTAKGGRFCIATGRSKEMTEEFVKTLQVNAPCVVYNGGGVYDFSRKEFLMREFLPDSCLQILADIRREMPRLAVLVIRGGSYYHVNDEIPFASYTELRKRKYESMKVEDLPLPWYKALFSVSPEEAPQFDAYLERNSFEGVRFVHTNATLVEMLPECSTKRYALEKLVELGHFSRENVVAIGDYYNDQEMIAFAGIGAVTAEAPDDLKAMADVVVGSCDGGAVADLVEYLESLCG